MKLTLMVEYLEPLKKLKLLGALPDHEHSHYYGGNVTHGWGFPHAHDDGYLTS
jgi:hypothetical protein